MSLPPELPEVRTRPVRIRFGAPKKAGRGIVEVMPKSELMPMKVMVLGLCLSLSCGAASEALAFDPQSGVSRESGPFDLFKFGFFSYKEGRKDDAVEAYRYAAEKGHTGSRWALANMYADGDGVQENDLEAFKIYSEIAQAGVEPGSEDTGYFANALIALASYYRRGIPDSPVKVDMTQARQLYFQASLPRRHQSRHRQVATRKHGNAAVFRYGAGSDVDRQRWPGAGPWSRDCSPCRHPSRGDHRVAGSPSRRVHPAPAAPSFT